jgi:hypothetical protein
MRYCQKLRAIRSPFAEHIFSRLQRSSALKSVPGAPLCSIPGSNPVAPKAFGAEDHCFVKFALMGPLSAWLTSLKTCFGRMQWSNGGESLAAPRAVSDASRRCKQRPSKFLIEGRFFSRIPISAATGRLGDGPTNRGEWRRIVENDGFATALNAQFFPELIEVRRNGSSSHLLVQLFQHRYSDGLIGDLQGAL